MKRIIYTNDLLDLSVESVQGFFQGWPRRPSSETLLRLLRSSTYCVVAIDPADKKCVGYVTALTDGVLFGYISSLEVLPEHQGQGIGQRLVSMVMDQLSTVYAVDLVCDEDVQAFYERCGLKRCYSMVARRPELIDPT